MRLLVSLWFGSSLLSKPRTRANFRTATLAGAGGLMPKVRRSKPVRGNAARGRRRSPVRASGSKQRTVEIALAELAHEIRTPLTGILALAELLATSDLPERERLWAAAIKGAADHLAQLTSMVVDAAKAGAAGLVLRTEWFSPRELVRAAAGSVAARAEGKGLDVEIAIADNTLPPRVRGDAVRLRGALENLIDNAVKFTEHGSIGFSASAERVGGGRVRLTFVVTDSGIGITKADLKQLLRPFAQASTEVARRYGGAGLGLHLVKRIALAMGGDLAVTSEPGCGSSFRLTATMDDGASETRRGDAHAAAAPGLRVLCVEDNPYGRVVLSTVLGELGHRTSFVGSGNAAVDTVARNGHDVVVMDVALAGIDGLEATRRIRALPAPAGRIPIIGLSGRSEDGDEAAALAAGMDFYLRKPASPAELHKALRAAVDLRRA
jgi:signal transduction histidine kinase/ActR/RegA family two-component response regulator